MNKKLYRKAYAFMCSSCGIFLNMNREYCEGCGMKGTIVEASKQDYKEAEVFA